MAIGKKVKVGGSFYKGYKLTVASAPGDSAVDMVESIPSAINGLTVTPTKFGDGDTFKLEHLEASGGKVLALLGTSIHNIGAGVTIMFDFSALEQMLASASLRLTYTNVASTAMSVFIVTEYIGINKTS